MQQTLRLFLLTIGIYFLSVAISHAAVGVDIPEFTGGVNDIFSALRTGTLVRNVGVAMFAFILFGALGGMLAGGWGIIMVGLLILGAWFGAEPIIDTIYTSGVII